ncbi:MAG: hypothetical protein GF331_11335 [Chitinivibrionales bacterium]|nr:hypothetical protein [Chitinivibrionales bacterium]
MPVSRFVGTRLSRRHVLPGTCLCAVFVLAAMHSHARAGLADSLCTVEATPCLRGMPENVANSLVSYLLIGSSNMMGRARPQSADSVPHPRVVSIDLGYGGWKPTIEPAMPHPSLGPLAGQGITLAFGKVLAEAFPDEYVGLVCCGQSGKNLQSYAQPKYGLASAWGAVFGLNQDGVYVGTWGNRRDIVTEAAGQSQRWGAIVLVAVPYGVLDTLLFAPMLCQIADSARAWLGDESIPFLVHEPAPYQIQVMGGAGSLGNAYKRVVHAIAGLIDNSAWVKADDLLNLEDSGEPPASGDVNIRTHFCHTSNTILGERFAQAVVSLRSSAAEGGDVAGARAPPQTVAQGHIQLNGVHISGSTGSAVYDLRGRAVLSGANTVGTSAVSSVVVTVGARLR